MNELQAAVDAVYYRRAVEFREDAFVFSGPQKTSRLYIAAVLAYLDGNYRPYVVFVQRFCTLFNFTIKT